METDSRVARSRRTMGGGAALTVRRRARRGGAGEPRRRLPRRRPTGHLRLYAAREGEEVALLAARAQRLADELHDFGGRDAEGRERARDAQRFSRRALRAACPG